MENKEKLPVSENRPEDYIIPLLAQALAAARSSNLNMLVHFIEMAMLQATDDKAKRQRVPKEQPKRRKLSTQPVHNRK